MISHLTLPGFKSEGIAYGFFGRKGGVSQGIYASLNGRAGSEDAPEAVLENRGRICRVIGAEPENLLTLYQIHSDKVLIAEKSWGGVRPEGDGIVTDKPGLALAVLTADCLPVLFTGRKADGAPVIAAAHAGWKGALYGVLENAVEVMKNAGASLESIEAVIGPSIAKKSYEVSAEFFENFVKIDAAHEKFFGDAQREGHFMFDLPGFAAARLAGCGVKKVVLSDVDTYSNPEDYFSYRRTTHRGEPDYGGQMSVIMIA